MAAVVVFKAVRLDIIAMRNDNLAFSMDFYSDALKTTAWPLTSYTAITLEVLLPNTQTSLVTLELGSGLTVASNRLTIAATKAQMLALSVGDYDYRVRASYTGNNDTLLYGTLEAI